MFLKHNRFAAVILMAASSVLFAAADAPTTTTAPRPKVSADEAHVRLGKNSDQPDAAWMKRHEKLVDQAKKGGVDLYFEGDSITDFWTSDNVKHGGKAIWQKEFAGWNAGDFGISADRTEHVLWRMENGELDGVSPKVVVLMIGTNNSGDCSSGEIAAGVTAIVNKFKEREPQAKILLLGIFPRGAGRDYPRRKVNEAANQIISKLDDGKQVKYLDIGEKFLDADGTLSTSIMPDLLHPNERGYQIWADAIKPQLTEWLGAPKEPAATMPAK